MFNLRRQFSQDHGQQRKDQKKEKLEHRRGKTIKEEKKKETTKITKSAQPKKSGRMDKVNCAAHLTRRQKCRLSGSTKIQGLFGTKPEVNTRRAVTE